MSKKRRKKRQKARQGGGYSALRRHHKKGSRLYSPGDELRFTDVQWMRDMVPEHLWIGALAMFYGPRKAEWPNIYGEMMDALDEVVGDQKLPPLGMVSDFSLVPADTRERFRKQHEALIQKAVLLPFGRVAAFYPDCPMGWLIEEDWLEAGGPLDPDMELGQLSTLLALLFDGKELTTGHVRAVPLNRLFKHNKLFITRGVSDDVVKLLPKYPAECNEEELYRVQQWARTALNVMYTIDGRYVDRAWPKYFWRQNYNLAPCGPRRVQPSGSEGVDRDDVRSVMIQNARCVKGYLDSLVSVPPVDLYDPRRDEVLLGLFARLTRLVVTLAQNESLWARDMAGILLRCIADTAITFVYLAKDGTDQEFEDFCQYSEGKEKLLMLHLQDSYPDRLSIDGRDVQAIGDDLGGFLAEVMQIELDSWTKKSARTLAQRAGLEEYYRLVYDPTSADLHGSWISVRESNLTYCETPLHRYHRLPSYSDPPVYVGYLGAAIRLYRECQRVAVDVLKFPAPKERVLRMPGDEREHEA